MADDIEALRQEVAYWRRDAVARAHSMACLVKAARDEGNMQEAIQIRVWILQPTLAAIDAAAEQDWHVNCEACAKPLITGQLVVSYEDAGEIHVDCDNPDAPVSGVPGEHVHAYDDGFSEDQMAKMLSFARAQNKLPEEEAVDG